MWASLHFILTEVKNLFFYPSSFAFPSHSIFNYMYYCIVSLFPFSALTFTWPIFVSRFWLNSILNICGYGMVPIAMYSNCWMVVFLPSKHSSGKAAFWVYDNNLLGRKGIKKHICIWKGKWIKFRRNNLAKRGRFLNFPFPRELQQIQWSNAANSIDNQEQELKISCDGLLSAATVNHCTRQLVSFLVSNRLLFLISFFPFFLFEKLY